MNLSDTTTNYYGMMFAIGMITITFVILYLWHKKYEGDESNE